MENITLWLAAETLEDAARVLGMLLSDHSPDEAGDILVANSVTPFECFAQDTAEMAGLQLWVAIVEDDALVSVEIVN